MEGLQHRPRPNIATRDADMDELLSNGYWKPSRVKAQASTSNRPVYITSPPVIRDSHKFTRPTLSRTSDLRNYKKPSCENELKSLSKELNSARASLTSLHDDEPPARGTIDQHPILLEADLSPADVLKYENQSRADEAWEQSKKNAKQDKNEEKRFVFIPTGTTYSPFNESEPPKGSKHSEKVAKSSSAERGNQCEGQRSDKSPCRTSHERRESRERRETREKTYHKDQKHDKDLENVRSQTLNLLLPPLSRHRSRQDLPTLKTQVHQESPPFSRSVSDYAISSQSPERRRREASRQQNGEYLLSPESPHTGRPPSKGYFDSVPRRFPSTQDPVITHHTLPEERGADVHLLTPKSATFPQEKRSSSAESKAGDTRSGALKHEVRRPNTSPMYYVTSDDESLTDDDDEPVVHQHSGREYHEDREHRHHGHHRKHSHNSKHPETNGDKYERHRRAGSKTNRGSLEVKPATRLASPLPSPNVSPTQTSFDFGGLDRKDSSRSSSFDLVKNLLAVGAAGAAAYMGGTDTMKSSQARPKSRRTSPSSESIKSPRSSTHSFNIPMPPRDDIHSSADGLLSPILNESSRKPRTPRSPTSLRTPQPLDTNGKPFWQPSSFFPEDNLHPSPVESHRRYSEDVSAGHTPRTHTCTREQPVAGKKDWLTLPGCLSFNICPSCFQANMGKTEFAKQFIPSPKRPADEEVVCSFGTCLWYRIAWHLTLREGRKDLRMFHNIAQIDSTVEPCLGPHHAIRTWHSVVDPATHKPVEGFNVCLSCVKSIESVLPPLKGIFVQKAPYQSGRSPVQRTRKCDMHFESTRFLKYFDVLEDTADTALSTFTPPNTAEFVAIAKKYAAIDECPGKKEVYDKKWHFIVDLPDFTVCPDCYEDVVKPGRKKGLWIPMMFDKVPRKTEDGEGARCALAGKEEKKWFEDTVKEMRSFSKFAKAVRDRRRMR